MRGAGEEDAAIAFVQADSSANYVASVVPLHGCVVVKPARAADAARMAGIAVADSVLTFAFVSPRTGKVYRNWPSCLSATREANDATKGAGAKTKAPGPTPPL